MHRCHLLLLLHLLHQEQGLAAVVAPLVVVEVLQLVVVELRMLVEPRGVGTHHSLLLLLPPCLGHHLVEAEVHHILHRLVVLHNLDKARVGEPHRVG